MSEFSVKKLLIGILCVVLAGLLGFGILQSNRRDQARSMRLQEINEQMSVLRSRKRELEAELAGLKKEKAEEISGMATFSLLLTDLDGTFAEQLAERLKPAGIPVVMAVSREQFPGEDGMITLEDFSQRLADGWDYCVAWGGEEDFDSWYADMAQRLGENDLSMPAVIYCAERSYTEEMAASASAKGMTTIVHSGEKNLPVVDTSFETPWKVGSIRWIASGARKLLEQAVEKHGSMAFLVDQVDFYEAEFSSMLSLVQQYQSEDSLMVGTFAEAMAYRKDIAIQNQNLQDAAYEARVLELKNEIEAVEEEIQALWKQ